MKHTSEGIPVEVTKDPNTGQEIHAHTIPLSESGQHISFEETVLERVEISPEVTRSACVEDMKEALNTQLTDDQKEAVGKLAKSTQNAIEGGIENNEDSIQGVLEGVLRERYGLSLEEILGAFRPTKLELLFPGTTTQAVAGEVAIFAFSRALDIKPADLSLSRKIEYRAKVSSDMLKIFALIAKFVPVASLMAIPAGMAGATLERVSSALGNINNKEDATILEGAKDVILAMLPRDANGDIDKEAVKKIIERTGGMIAESNSEDEYVRSVGEYIQKNPELFAQTAKELFSRS